MDSARDDEVYERQGFGKPLALGLPAGLLIVDFINGFANPAIFGGGNIPTAITRTIPLLELARERGWPIAYSRTVFADDGADANVFTEKIPGNLLFTDRSEHSQVVRELAPNAGEMLVRKQFPSAFFATPLGAWLTSKQVNTLVVVGATTSGCVRATVVDAMCHGFRPVVVEDCVGDRSARQHEANLFDMRMKCAEVMDRDTVMRHAALSSGR